MLQFHPRTSEASAERDPGISPWDMVPGVETRQMACYGVARCTSYTKKCGEPEAYHSILHDCQPILGCQHENTVGGGNGGVFPRKPLGDGQFRAFAVRDEMVLTGGCV